MKLLNGRYDVIFTGGILFDMPACFSIHQASSKKALTLKRIGTVDCFPLHPSPLGQILFF